MQAGRVIPFGTGKKGILYRCNGIAAHIEVEQIMQGLGNHHIAVEIQGAVDRQVLHHQAEKCGIRNMGQAAILAEVDFDFDVIQAVAAGCELLVGIVDLFPPEGIVHEVEIDICVVGTDGFHQGMNLLGIAGIGGKDDGDVAHCLNSLYLQCLKFY